MLLRLAARDALVLVATLGLWIVDQERRADEPGGVALGVAVLTALATVLCGYLVHEWGHLTGAWLRGAVVHPAERLASVFLFRFDSDRNDREQFLWMSVGGFVASGLAIAVLLLTLPLDALSGRLSMGLVALGVLATAVLELPVAWRVSRGAPLPRGVAYASSAG